MAAQSKRAFAGKRTGAPFVVGAIAVLLAIALTVFAFVVGSDVGSASVASDAAPVVSAQAASASDLAADSQSGDSAPALSAKTAVGGFSVVTWILLAGIASACVYFVLCTRRVEDDIAQMESSVL